MVKIKRENPGALKLTALGVAYACAVAFSAPAGAAYLGSIVNSWDARHFLGQEVVYPFGVAYDDGYLWVSCGNYLLKRCPSNGSIVKSVHTPDRSLSDMGYDKTRGYFYGRLSWYDVGVIEADTGRIVERLRVPPGAEGSTTVAFSRDAVTPLWVASPVEPVIWRMTGRGKVVASYVPQFPCYYINGLAYAENTPVGRVLFAGQQYMSVPSRVFALRPRDGSILYSFISPLPQNSLTDLTWDGKYLWGIHVVRSRIPAYIYQFVATADVAVEPSSIGRVKAMYR